MSGTELKKVFFIFFSIKTSNLSLFAYLMFCLAWQDISFEWSYISQVYGVEKLCLVPVKKN